MPTWATVLAVILSSTGALASVLIFVFKRFEKNTRESAENTIKSEMASNANKRLEAINKVEANKSTIEQTIVDMKEGDF